MANQLKMAMTEFDCPLAGNDPEGSPSAGGFGRIPVTTQAGSTLANAREPIDQAPGNFAGISAAPPANASSARAGSTAGKWPAVDRVARPRWPSSIDPFSVDFAWNA